MLKLSHRIRRIENELANRPCPDCSTKRSVLCLDREQPVPDSVGEKCKRCGRAWNPEIFRMVESKVDAYPVWNNGQEQPG